MTEAANQDTKAGVDPRSQGSTTGPLLREIILENFMSYEYARIPIRPGLNVVCGPNGSGKSSILVALSVALGQAYTERSRKLSDLIRWGKDTARVTLVFDNYPRKGGRPISHSQSDLYMISRYLKIDGTYWYEAEHRVIGKAEIERILSEFGINPDNMLIIMHQNMIEEFSITNEQQKLRMVEEAVGFQDYRANILEAQAKLSKLLSEEEAIFKFLQDAEQTLEYWKGEYQRLMRRRGLLARKASLEVELAWAQVARISTSLESLGSKIERKTERLQRMEERVQEAAMLVENRRNRLNELRLEQERLFYTIIALEKEKTELDILAKVSGSLSPQQASKVLEYQEQPSSKDSPPALSVRLEHKIEESNSRLATLRERLGKSIESYVESSVGKAVLEYQIESLKVEISELETERREVQTQLADKIVQAEGVGSRVQTNRSPQEVSDEIKLVIAQIATVGEVSDDTEKMYQTYVKLHGELTERTSTLSENRKKALKEVEARREVWRQALSNWVEKVNPSYQSILEVIDATGRVRLTNMEDVETAGLELLVGFKGAKPSVLDAYTQSGGERSTAVMSFLLAVQQLVVSPIRAVDEFDVHMDPMNREMISKALVTVFRGRTDAQYIMLTPSQLAVVDQWSHIITVQNLQGRSEVKTVE